MKLKCEAHSIGSFNHSLQHVLATFCQAVEVSWQIITSLYQLPILLSHSVNYQSINSAAWWCKCYGIKVTNERSPVRLPAVHFQLITSQFIKVNQSGLKYNTAKPLPNTVYRTRCRKQLWGKWSGEKLSLEAVPKNSKHRSWGDIGWQTIPEADFSQRKRMIADSGQPCTLDH